MTIGRVSISEIIKKTNTLSSQKLLSTSLLSGFYSRLIAGVFAKKRLTALLLCVVITYGALFPTAYALFVASNHASADASTDSSTHKTSAKPSIGKINMTPAVAPSTTLKQKYPAAANAVAAVGGKNSSFLAQVQGVTNNPIVSPVDTSNSKPTFTPHELVNDRTANLSMHLNKDGTITKTTYLSPHFYKTNGAWQPIDNTLVADDNAADSGNILGEALGKVESLVSSPNAYKTQANSWEARFTPSDFSGGMVRIKQGSSQVGFSPVNANTVDPVITKNSAGQRVVRYNGLWSGTDVEYTIESDQVKEAVIINNKQAASEVQFKVIGASLQKPPKASTPTDPQPAFTINGALGNQFGVTPANLILNHYGFVDPANSGLTQDYANGTLTVGVDSSYLHNLPSSAFPAVIDPTVTSTFGTRGGGNFISFEQNGPTCYSNTCLLYVGDGYDSNNVWQSWHGALFAPYSIFQNSGVSLTNASLTLTQETGNASWVGNTNTYNYQVSNFTCLTGYNCAGSTLDSGNVGSTASTIDVTNIYQNLISTGNWYNWLMLAGDDGTGNASFKAFDPDNSYVTFTYTTKLAPPTIITPQPGMVYADPQASFSLDAEANPNDGTPLEYQMRVTDGAGGTGAVVNSGGWLNSVDWTVPDGVLQNGTTYYLQAQSYDPSTGYTSPWGTPTPFRIDLREGTNSTQTYDTVGPVKVDLATGNVETGVASHSTAALSGSLGVDLNYNSPIKSSPGLAASYWNVPSGYGGGAPSSPPNLARVDQNINFYWNSGSPGGTITSSWFYGLWTGYFVAPATGTYYFGGVNDYGMAITVNGTTVYSNGGCHSGPCYGSSITLTAGQVVSFQTAYLHGTGADYAQVYVSGAVPQQIVPGAWFQTGVRQLHTNGLLGHYYTYTDNGNPPTIPSDGTDGLFLTRVDPILNFNWTGTLPVTNGPQADWMAQWTGYLTVPTTGSYVFGAQSDDGSTVTVNGTQVYSHWQDGSTTGYGTAISLTGGQSVPITIDYYQHLGGDSMSLLVQPLGGASEVVPSNWLTPYKSVVPAGWSLGINPTGTASYTHLTVNTDNAVLTDDGGDTYDYTWNGTGYSPPAGSSGFLNRNNDGSFTLQDGNGETYVFGQAGDLESVTSAADTGGNPSITYTYGAVNSNGPDAVQQITDGVNSNRWAKVYYGGTSQCGTPPSGFGATPTNMLCALQTNDGRTTYFYYDTNGNLAEVAKPGNDDTTYQYQAVLNSAGSTIGYQLTGIRNDLANDAVVAGERVNDESTYTQIQYNALGRVSSVAEPAATVGVSQLTKTFVYTTGQTVEHVTGATEPAGYSERVQYDYQGRTTAVYNDLGQATATQWDPIQDLQYSSTNPEGLMTTNVYNDLDELVSQYGPAPASDFNTWSTTLAPGQSMSEGQSLWSEDHRFEFTFQTDGNLVLFGPNGWIWAAGTGGQTATRLTMQSDGNLVEFNGNTPLWNSGSNTSGPSTYFTVQNDGNAVLYNAYGPVWSTGTGVFHESGQQEYSGYGWPANPNNTSIAETDTMYGSQDNPSGLSVNYFKVTEPAPNDASLSGGPQVHATGFTGAQNWGSTSPIPNYSGSWGLSMTGAMRLNETPDGSNVWNIYVQTDGGVRMWIDNKLVMDHWADNPSSSPQTFEYTYTGIQGLTWQDFQDAHAVRIDYYHPTSQSNAQFNVYMTEPNYNGGNFQFPGYDFFYNAYGLQTSATSYDSAIGNTKVTTAYGSDPGLGQVASTTVDPNGLNLTANDAYQAPGSGYGMLTSQTAPGGAATSYGYYGASDTSANPCVIGSPTAYQAGMLKTVTQPSGEVVTQVYDDSGNVVASETNSDGWECRTNDSRGRLTQDVIPAFNGSPSRTITYNYDVGGNPLVGSETDSQGTITTTIDLLGRTVSYTDVNNDTTTTSYDTLGRVSGDNGPLGTEAYTYNSYNQLTKQTLGGTSLAQPSYDQYGRLSTVTYPTASVTETIGYDPSYGYLDSDSYSLPSSEVITDSDTHSQSGKILTDTTAFGSSSSAWSYTYDLADRLTAASSTGAIGSNSYSYSYGSESGSCPTGTNANAGKDGNRTSQTINGVTTTYCYNPADQLTASSNAAVDAATYDSHGNTTSFGSTGNVTSFAYDASDHNKSITQGSQSTTYARDVTGSIVSRVVSTGSGSTTTNYGFTGSGSSFAMNSSYTVTEDYLSLPGGLSLTIRPGQSGAASQTASLSNIHGNVIATLDGTNTLNGTFTYDPFGNLVSTGGQPGNTTNGAAFGWAGASGKFSETALSLAPIQMGARVYIPSIGRFTSEDSAPGTLPNLYTYPLDPINQSDLSGESACGGIACFSISPARGIALQSTISAAQLITSTARNTEIKVEETKKRASAKRTPAAPAPKSQPVNPPASSIAEKPINFKGLNQNALATAPTGNPQVFDLYNAGGSAMDWFAGGALFGGIGGCILGALATIEFAGVGCVAGAVDAETIVPWAGAAIGFVLGGFDAPGSGAFEWGPDQVHAPWEK